MEARLESWKDRPLGYAFLKLIHEKKTNLCVSADVTNKERLLEIAESLGDEICMLKTHVDIIEDFDMDFLRKLSEIAARRKFFIFEDRKFADIGNTVKHQYGGGIYKISTWSHFTNAHVVPGEGIIKGLHECAKTTKSIDDSEWLKHSRGLLLLAEMSSVGSLATGSYTDEAVKMALQNEEFVLGFIAGRRLTNQRDFLYLTPGIQLEASKDSLGQQYRTPEYIIGECESDVIIVGRGIYESETPLETARKYRERGWESYVRRFS